MKGSEIAEELGNVLEEDSNRPNVYGEYHPSTVSGCPLKEFLNWMVDNETTLNRWLFQGSAVHYYLQEAPGKLTRALEQAGYHPLNVDYEVPGSHLVERNVFDEDIVITGHCDVLISEGDHTAIIDIKYSSVPPSSGHGRLWKYASQVNTYANMFDADEWGLLMINSKSDNIPEDIAMISQEADDENFELMKDKARWLHQLFHDYGYDEGERFEMSELHADMMDLWEEVMDVIDKRQCPAYEKECRYCDHEPHCPVKQGKVGGLKGLANK